ncbi:MAG: bifunctional ornithine acetyltransferase/N-acetylglutamate synthase, partial [Paracoccaceae bacterium]|nr:bifunctional ornithine acetyltransferase/N-acetylglutamate synthase [Paracoccaceae bacterium]
MAKDKAKGKKANKDKAAKAKDKAKAKAAKAVAPLAPKGGFPSLPEIGGAEFAAVAAGVRYQGRLDVML